MSTNRQMDKENVVYGFNNVIHPQKGNVIICGNMGEPGGYYAIWNKPDT